MNDQIRNDADTLLRNGAALGGARSPISPGMQSDIDPAMGIPYVVVPDGYTVHDLERLLPTPTRKRGAVVCTLSDSFIEYLNKHGDPDVSTIYADIDSAKATCAMVAVLDDHAADYANWRNHTCTFAPTASVEWTRWISNDKKPMGQGEFAAFLEDNLADVATVEGMPTAAQMLAMALAFEATADKRLKSRINLQSGGVRFEYVEDEDKDTRTSMEAFQRFTIGIPVFENSGSAYPIEARLKYREKEGRVTFWFELIRPDKVFKTAVREELEHISTATWLDILHGKKG